MKKSWTFPKIGETMAWLVSTFIFYLSGQGVDGGSASGTIRKSTTRFTMRQTYYSYVPDIRYSRAYRGLYTTPYYASYFTFARTTLYKSRSPPTPGKGVCLNYESNDNGTAMGAFVCPLLMEPRDYTSCCGEAYAEYCCSKTLGLGGLSEIIICFVLAVVILACCATSFLLKKINRRCLKLHPAETPSTGLKKRDVFSRLRGYYVRRLLHHGPQMVSQRNPQNEEAEAMTTANGIAYYAPITLTPMFERENTDHIFCVTPRRTEVDDTSKHSSRESTGRTAPPSVYIVGENPPRDHTSTGEPPPSYSEAVGL